MSSRTIKAKKISKDVHRGLNDSELMNKYQLTQKQLQKILQTLFNANLITDMQLYERTQLSETQFYKAFSDANDT
jgi:hypothetical protein